MKPILRFGLIGLGRLGKIHAHNLVHHIGGAQLVAVCSLDEAELMEAQRTLGVSETYTDYETMVKSPNLDAVVIVSPSGLHVDHIRLALANNLHVFCEKPIGIDIAAIKSVLPMIEKSDKQFMLGFMRRYDESYAYAKTLIEAGELGEIAVMRCYSIDPARDIDGFLQFVQNGKSGGVFFDMAVHDIDVIRWLTGSEGKRVWATGYNKAYPHLTALGELETGTAMLELADNTVCFLLSGRNAAHGYQVETEIIGTKGSLTIAHHPEKNLVTLFNEQGVVRPCSLNFPERFRQAFVSELQAFVACIHDDQPPSITAHDGLMASVVAQAMEDSFVSQTIVAIPSPTQVLGQDEGGNP